jgi:ABC-type glycerol-3-phosphate transport system substrate-binding protein
MPGRQPTTRREFLRLTTVGAASAAILAACGQGGAQTVPSSAAGSATQPPGAAKAEAITFWPRSPSEQSVVWEKLLPIQKQMFPELTVKLEAPAEDQYGKLLVAYAGGTAPDSVVTGLSAFRSMVGKKMLKPVQPYIDADNDVKSWLPDYVPAAIKGYTYKSQLYAVPTVNESIVLWYDKDAIVEAGLTPPREIENDPNKWNWDTVVTYARALNKGTGFRRERFGVVCTGEKGPPAFSEAWGNLMYARGGRLLDEAGEKSTFDSAETRDTLQWVVDLIFKHDVHPDVGESTSAQLRDRAFFQNRQVAMVVQGEYFRRYLWGSGKPSGGIPFNYDLAMMPFATATGKRTNIYHGNGSFLISQSKSPDATWKWLKVIFTKDAQQIITDTWGSRGGHVGTYGPWLKSNAGGGPDGLNYDAMIKADADAEPYPATTYLTNVAVLEPPTRILYDNVFLNKMPVAEGASQIDKEINALLDRARKEMGPQG